MRITMRSPLARRTLAVATIVATGSTFHGVMRPEPSALLLAQQPPPPPRSPFEGPAPAPSPIERIGPDVVRVGAVRVDTARKELSVNGFVNDVTVLEFLANTKGGWKAYESALELETNAINFNVACLLIGLDPAGAVISRFQFDPALPQGHPVEIFVEWDEGGRRRRVRAEELIYNRTTKETLTEGPWVYTGSVFREGNFYMAETEGTLIGFMHTTAPIIESPRPLSSRYGEAIVNPGLNLKPGTPVSLLVRALPRTGPRK
jgi:hypothetical protein